MSGSPYIWIAVGDASGLPVFATTENHIMHHWLMTRRSNRMLRIFRHGGPRGMIEVCKRCFLNAPNQPVSQRGHHG